MLKFLSKSLRTKILIGYVVILLIMLFVMFWGIYNFQRLNESFRQVMIQNYSSIVASDNMVKSLDNQVDALLIILYQDKNIGKNLFEESKKDFYHSYQKARESAYTQREIFVLDSLNNLYESFLKEVGTIISISDRNRTQKKINANYFTNIITSIGKIKNKCYVLFEINHSLINNTNQQVKDITRTASFFMFFIVISGIIISLVISIRFSGYVVKPLHELTKSVKYISEGNFEFRIKTLTEDEIGTLGIEFNKMVEKLQNYEKLNINKILYEKRKSEVIIESINDPVMMIDSNMNILLGNKSFKEIFDISNFDGLKLTDVIKEEKLISSILDVFKNKNEINFDNIIHTKEIDGYKKFYKPVCSIITVPDSNITGTVIVFNDITKYEELDRMKSEFVAKTSHEFKTPLTSIGMGIGILQDNVLGKLNAKQKDLINSMKIDYERLNKLVKEILELSKIEAGGINLKFEVVNIRSLIENTAKSFLLQSTEKGINIKFEVEQDLPNIYADADYLSRAIGNFVSNSIKFTDSGGTINLIGARKNKSVSIIISDTGKGIKSEDIDKIFDKFVQIGESFPGSVGLGLPIAKEIIQLHGGEVKVSSEVEKGSKFEIILPIYIYEQSKSFSN